MTRMIEKFIEHYQQGKANGHPFAGCIGTMAAASIGALFGFVPFLLGLLFGSLAMGIAIEAWQRLYRWIRGRPQNTWRESLLDALVTWLWPIILLLKRASTNVRKS